MHRTLLPTALLTLPAVVAGVSLADFPPYLSGLPIGCAIVYKQPIIGCSTSDFGPDRWCSAGCVRALQDMVPAVDTACANHNIVGQNIIVAFLANAGPQSVCRNANQILSSSGIASTSAAPSTSSTAASSTSERATSTTFTSSDSTTTTSQSQTSSTQTTSALPMASLATTTAASSLVMDSSSSPSTALPTSSSVLLSQTGANDGSGGGSPFDSPGNTESAAAVATCAFSISLFTISALLLAILR